MSKSVYPPTLRDAFRETGDFDETVATCPHCGVEGVSFHKYGYAYESPSGRTSGAMVPGIRTPISGVAVGWCGKCKGLVIGACHITYEPAATPRPSAMLNEPQIQTKTVGTLLWPTPVAPDKAPANLDSSIRQDYDEARRVLDSSPQAAAALARRCLQQVLREKLKVKEGRLEEEIDQACHKDDLSKPARSALDHVRKLGNWAAHPAKDCADVLIRVTPSEATYTLRALEMCFHDLYIAPTEIAAMEESIRMKKAGAT